MSIKKIMICDLCGKEINAAYGSIRLSKHKFDFDNKKLKAGTVDVCNQCLSILNSDKQLEMYSKDKTRLNVKAFVNWCQDHKVNFSNITDEECDKICNQYFFDKSI